MARAPGRSVRRGEGAGAGTGRQSGSGSPGGRMKRRAWRAARGQRLGECCTATLAGAARKAEKAIAEKRRPPCCHGGLESREETPKEGICGRSCRTATISALSPAVASLFFVQRAL